MSISVSHSRSLASRRYDPARLENRACKIGSRVARAIRSNSAAFPIYSVAPRTGYSFVCCSGKTTILAEGSCPGVVRGRYLRTFWESRPERKQRVRHTLRMDNLDARKEEALVMV